MTFPERRYTSVFDLGEDGVSVEARDGDPVKIRGIAPPWDSLSVDLGGFREKFSPTAFDKILSRKKIDVPLLFNHDDSRILARTTNGTLRLEKTDRGLLYEADPVPTATAEEVVALIRSKTIYGSSFSFTVGPRGEEWDEDERGRVTRTVTEASGLYDVSPVTRPAYPGSSVGLRSLEQWRTARGLLQHRDQGRPLVISLDYDQTFTAAPGLWRSFVADAAARGNRVVCITRREDTEENRAEISVSFENMEISDVILCGGNTRKRAAAAAAGIEVDVWIDDSPEIIPVETEARVIPRVSTIAGARAAAAAALARLADVRTR